jgi:hypothetical protein
LVTSCSPLARVISKRPGPRGIVGVLIVRNLRVLARR